MHEARRKHFSNRIAWHNFWLAKSSYLKGFPALTSNRYYYEYWLSGINKDDANISNGVIRESPREQQHNSQQEKTLTI